MINNIALFLLTLFLIAGTNIPFPTTPVPVGQDNFQYDPITDPAINTEPSLARPIGVGSIAEGGDTVDIQINLSQFSEPVDVYLGIYAPSIDQNNIYILKSDSTLQPISAGFEPWLENTYGPTFWDEFEDIPTSSLLSGIYYFYLAVTPASSLNAYYLWTTYFVLDTSPPSVPTGVSATAVSSSQITLSWNSSTDDVSIAGYKIYRNGTYIQSVTNTSFVDAGLNSLTQYCYTISAYDSGENESDKSTQACARTPEKVCEPLYLEINPTYILKTLRVGENIGDSLITIRDNCRNYLHYTVTEVSVDTMPPWISTPTVYSQGEGVLTITYNTAHLSIGTYNGRIKVTPDGFNTITIPITLYVTSSGENGLIPLQNNYWSKFSLTPGAVKYFSFSAVNSQPSYPLLIVKLEPQLNEYRGGDMLVRYAGTTCDSSKLPTLQDLENVKNFCQQNGGCQPIWDDRTKTYSPPRYKDYFYYGLSGDSFELVEIYGDPLYPLGCYYIMVYNNATMENLLKVSYTEY